MTTEARVTHTPGPWSIFENHCIVAANGDHVVCAGHDYDEGGIIGEDADARLIAAAPDLLAALKAIAENSDEENEWDAVAKLMVNKSRAKEAISKAELQ
jgi:hypothetical protein